MIIYDQYLMLHTICKLHREFEYYYQLIKVMTTQHSIAITC